MRAKPDTFVLLTVALIVSSSYLASVENKKPLTIRPLLGGFALGIFLYLITAVDDGIGRGFAILAATVALLKSGDATFKFLGSLGGTK